MKGSSHSFTVKVVNDWLSKGARWEFLQSLLALVVVEEERSIVCSCCKLFISLVLISYFGQANILGSIEFELVSFLGGSWSKALSIDIIDINVGSKNLKLSKVL